MTPEERERMEADGWTFSEDGSHCWFDEKIDLPMPIDASPLAPAWREILELSKIVNNAIRRQRRVVRLPEEFEANRESN